MYDISPPPPDPDVITIGDERRYRVEYVDIMDVLFRGFTDAPGMRKRHLTAVTIPRSASFLRNQPEYM